jgi:hypothetical protein
MNLARQRKKATEIAHLSLFIIFNSSIIHSSFSFIHYSFNNNNHGNRYND